ncbi:MAG: DNA-processing protein DprA [Methylomonas sp.]|nr:DNA-processing protein DprA [Methylomonas sp.]PPD20058.1 MAG: DNA-protecting protein DprA [Methylomonas sp.]PPD26001.1 MAG: DNA-protecting protein DprA [Methylomonas sp.]PPD37730.1 MAG: DNA-protecting protein DprA [Methylomonas sp.]PPD39590.1 MAG: DNA-protecting protein DprA [Methylomonas sp.]
MDAPQATELKYWLALVRMPGIGAVGIQRLLTRWSLDEIFSASRAQLAASGVNDRLIDVLLNPPWALVDQDMDWLAEPENHALTLACAAYPEQLKAISSPPPVLFVKGHPTVLHTPQIGMVGSRNPSVSGSKMASEFASALVSAGFTITSGMALGIDAASHQGAIAANGLTIAVTGTGLDRVYPARHKQLATDIVAHGALVSEFPPGTQARADHFPRRNRIISGLCQGLLVVEAAQQSGSLITARLALDQGREVFAIPGSIYNPLAHGCNALIRQGAKLVETVEDIFEELGQYNQTYIQPTTEFAAPALDLEQQNLLNLVPYSPVTVDTLVQDSGYSVEVVSSMLLVLELQGYIAAAPGSSYYRLGCK